MSSKRYDTRAIPSAYPEEPNKYGKNQVFESPAGHQVQVDSTGEGRLYVRWSPAGTYSEYTGDGSGRHYNVGDFNQYNAGGCCTTTDENTDGKKGGHDREILGGGGQREYSGDLGVGVGGTTAFVGMGPVNMRAVTIYIGADGNMNINCGGNMSIKVSGTTTIESGGNMTLKAPRIDLNP